MAIASTEKTPSTSRQSSTNKPKPSRDSGSSARNVRGPRPTLRKSAGEKTERGAERKGAGGAAKASQEAHGLLATQAPVMSGMPVLSAFHPPSAQSIGDAAAGMVEKAAGGLNGTILAASNGPRTKSDSSSVPHNSTTTTTDTLVGSKAKTPVKRRRKEQYKADWEALYRHPEKDSHLLHQVFDFSKLEQYREDPKAWKKALENRRTSGTKQKKPYELFDYPPTLTDRALVLHRLFGPTPYLVESNQVEWEGVNRRVLPLVEQVTRRELPRVNISSQRLRLKEFSLNYTPTTLATPRSKLIESLQLIPTIYRIVIEASDSRTPVKFEDIVLVFNGNDVTEMTHRDGRELSKRGFFKKLEDSRFSEPILYRTNRSSEWELLTSNFFKTHVTVHIKSQGKSYPPADFLKQHLVV